MATTEPWKLRDNTVGGLNVPSRYLKKWLDVIERAGAVLATFQQVRCCWLNPKANDDSSFTPVYSYDHSAGEFQRFVISIFPSMVLSEYLVSKYMTLELVQLILGALFSSICYVV